MRVNMTLSIIIMISMVRMIVMISMFGVVVMITIMIMPFK